MKHSIPLSPANLSKLRTARESQGLTVSALAAQLGKSQAYLSFLESGRKRPSGDLLCEWARALGLRVEVETRVKLTNC